MLRKHLKAHHTEAWQWARQCCHFEDEMAKDVIQVVYLKILEGRANWDQRSAFRTWLYSVIRFTAIDEMRKDQRFMSLSSDHEEAATEDTPDMEDYKSVIRRLPARQAEVLLLTFYHDMTLEQVAAVTGLHIGTIRTHYDRGKKGLRKLLTEDSMKYA